MGPSKKHREDAADERRQTIADNRLVEQKVAAKAAEAERKATEKKGGR